MCLVQFWLLPPAFYFCFSTRPRIDLTTARAKKSRDLRITRTRGRPVLNGETSEPASLHRPYTCTYNYCAFANLFASFLFVKKQWYPPLVVPRSQVSIQTYTMYPVCTHVRTCCVFGRLHVEKRGGASWLQNGIASKAKKSASSFPCYSSIILDDVYCRDLPTVAPILVSCRWAPATLVFFCWGRGHCAVPIFAAKHPRELLY